MPLSDGLWKGLAEQSPIAGDYYAQDASLSRAIQQYQSRAHYTPEYFDEDGTPTPFAPESRGFWGTVAGRINRGSSELGDAWLWNSLAAGIVNLFDKEYKHPGQVSAGNLMHPDGPIPIGEATATQVWDTMDPHTVAMIERSGMSKDRLIKEVNDDAGELNNWYQEFVERTRNQQQLDAYAEEHGALYWAAGATAAIADIATDPINIATLGTGFAVSAGKSGVTAAAKAIGKVVGTSGSRSAVGRSIATRAARFQHSIKQGSIVNALIEAGTPIQKEWAARVMIGSLTAENVTADIFMQHAEHETAIRYGLLEEDADFRLSYGRLAVTGMLSMALGSLAAKSMGMSGWKFTFREYAAHNKNNPTTIYLQNLVQRGKLAPDEIMPKDLVSNLESMDQVMKGSFGVEDYKEIMARIDDSMLVDSPEGMAHLTDFVSKRPDKKELIDEILKYTDRDVNQSLATGERMRSYYKMIEDVQSGNLKTPTTAWDKAFQIRQKRVAELSSAAASKDPDRVAEAQKNLTKAENRLNKIRNSFNVTTTPKGISGPVKKYLKTVMAPKLVSARSDPTQVTARSKLIAEAWLKSPKTIVKRHVPKVEAALGALSIGIPTRAINKAMKDGTEFSRLMFGLRAALDDTGLHGYAVGADGQSVKTVYQRMATMRGLRTDLMKSLRKKLGKKAVQHNETVEDYGEKVLQSIALGRKLDDPELEDIAKELRKYLDDMNTRGIIAGHFATSLENFLPVKLFRDVAAKHAGYLTSKLADTYKANYGLADMDANSFVYRKMLREEHGILTPEDAVEIETILATLKVGEGFKVSDLPDYAQKNYWDRLEGVLEAEAKSAIDKRLALPRDQISNDQELRNLRTGEYTLETHARKIEQEFWYRDDILKIKNADGSVDRILDVNLSHVTSQYENSTGYSIATQETMTEMFGEPITWNAMVDMLGGMATDPTQDKLVKRLKDVASIAAGRKGVTDSDSFIEFASSLTRTITYGAVPVTILGTEGAVTMARAIGAGNIRQMLRVPKMFLTKLSEDDMRIAGFAHDYEWDNARIWGITEDLLSSDTTNRAVGLMHNAERFARSWGGEQYITRRLKMLHFMQSSGVMYKYRNKLDKFLELDVSMDRSTPDGRKAFLAQTRKLGLREDHVELMIRNNVITPEHIEALKAFKQLDKDTLTNVFKMRERLNDLPEDVRPKAESMIQSLTDYGTMDAEAFVTTPTPNTMHRGDSAITNMFLMYTTFPLAFAQRTARRAFMAPMTKTYGYLATYLMGEMFSTTLRKVIHEGENPEDILNDWQENPEENAAMVMLRAPLMGPWNMGIETIASMFLDRPLGYSTGGAAAMSRVFRTGQQAIEAGRQLVTGDAEDINRAGMRLANTLPFTNMWWSRIPLGLSAAYREDAEYFNEFFAPFENFNEPLPPGLGNRQPRPETNGLPLQESDPNLMITDTRQPSISTGSQDFDQSEGNTGPDPASIEMFDEDIMDVSEALDLLNDDPGDDPGSVDTMG